MRLYANKKKKTAFTMIELLVSMGILAILVIMLTRVYSNTLITFQRARELVIMDEYARFLMTFMGERLTMADTAPWYPQFRLRTNMTKKVGFKGNWSYDTDDPAQMYFDKNRVAYDIEFWSYYCNPGGSDNNHHNGGLNRFHVIEVENTQVKKHYYTLKYYPNALTIYRPDHFHDCYPMGSEIDSSPLFFKRFSSKTYPILSGGQGHDLIYNVTAFQLLPEGRRNLPSFNHETAPNIEGLNTSRSNYRGTIYNSEHHVTLEPKSEYSNSVPRYVDVYFATLGDSDASQASMYWDYYESTGESAASLATMQDFIRKNEQVYFRRMRMKQRRRTQKIYEEWSYYRDLVPEHWWEYNPSMW